MIIRKFVRTLANDDVWKKNLIQISKYANLHNMFHIIHHENSIPPIQKYVYR